MNSGSVFDEVSIDWSRLPEPQADGYDTDIVLLLASCAGYTCRDVGDNPTILDGKVAVRQPEVNYCVPDGWKPAPSDDPNLAFATDFLECWPEVLQQFSKIIHSVYPYSEPNLGRGSCSGPAQDASAKSAKVPYTGKIFGAINVTVFDPIGTSEALVHELAHQKLWALGIDFEYASRLVLNPQTECYPSPVRRNPRPMTALIHAAYAWLYIVNLQLRMIPFEDEKGVEPEVIQVFVKGYFARNLLNLTKALKVVVENVKYDAAGEAFFGSLFEWGTRLITEGNQVLTEGNFESDSCVKG
ncbi:MAG: HEXXH motif-containing putative peptide modification protein [Candidatus Poribacteria bacterium]|nr:HEXXH motif-containing putative peptide modification protein [Candidatus Poribacteria bacterium]